MPYTPTLPQFPLLAEVWETIPPDESTPPDFSGIQIAVYFPRMTSEIHQVWVSYAYKAVLYGRTPLESENPGGWAPSPGNLIAVPYSHQEGKLYLEVLDAAPANMGFPNEYIGILLVRYRFPG